MDDTTRDALISEIGFTLGFIVARLYVYNLTAEEIHALVDDALTGTTLIRPHEKRATPLRLE